MIYKVLTLNEWQSAKESGTIVTEIDQNDGFVHLSTSSQLSATLSMYFKAPSEVMLLQINFNKVEEILNEDGRLFIRESGTQPLIRILIEHKSEDILAKAKEIIKSII